MLSVASTTAIRHDKVKPKSPPPPDPAEEAFEQMYACVTCEGGQDEDKLLLCDGCDAGYHTYCLEPALDVIPSGEWLCPQCENEQEHSWSHSTSLRAGGGAGAGAGATSSRRNRRRHRNRQRGGGEAEYVALGDDYDETHEFTEEEICNYERASSGSFGVSFEDVINHQLRFETERRNGNQLTPRRRAHNRDEHARKSALQLLKERRRARDLPVAVSPD